jgi:cytochrome b561
MKPAAYDRFTQALHWSAALLVIGVYAIAVSREFVPKGDFRSWLLSLHMSGGMLIMALTVVRLGWRSVSPAPPMPSAKPAMKLAARLAHFTLYASLIAIPVSGLVSAWLKGRIVTFMGLFPIASPFAGNSSLGGRIEDIHEIAGQLMMALVAVHALAAIVHQYVLKDGVLSRMLPQASGAQRTA